MATIQDALQSGVLETLKLPKWELRSPIRPMFVAPDFYEWFENTNELFDEKFMKGGKYLADHME